MITLPTHIIAAGAIIFNDNSEILMIKNPRKGWEYPGGMIDCGETLIQGLKREVKEETGIEINIIKMIGMYSNIKTQPGYNGVKEIPTTLIMDFICQYDSGLLSTSEESLEIGWFSSEEALARINPRQKYRLEAALKQQNGIIFTGFEFDDEYEAIIHEEHLIKNE
ncbi:MAG: NUDIX hydrolase [Turicibacter sp.]